MFVWTFLAFYMNFECCTLETMCLIVLFKFFYAIPILQCLWVSSFLPFSPTCSFTVPENFSHIATNSCLMYFHEDSSMQQSVNFTIQLTGGSAGTQAIATFICTRKIKTLTLLFCYFADVADVLGTNKVWILPSSWQGGLLGPKPLLPLFALAR